MKFSNLMPKTNAEITQKTINLIKKLNVQLHLFQSYDFEVACFIKKTAVLLTYARF